MPRTHDLVLWQRFGKRLPVLELLENAAYEPCLFFRVSMCVWHRALTRVLIVGTVETSLLSVI